MITQQTKSSAWKLWFPDAALFLMEKRTVHGRPRRRGFALFMTIVATTTLQACSGSDDNNAAPGVAGAGQALAVNLFPGETNRDEPAASLSLREAMAKSERVYCASGLEKIDSSSAHGAKTFYLYQVSGGAQVVHAPSGLQLRSTPKGELPVLFIADKSLFVGRRYDDSVFVFLHPLQDHRLLQLRMHVRYEWVECAPFGLSGMEELE
ncbi:MAG: hypothetical protein EOP49_50700 [Sphingobacteriales bacterium]|nr:MAG: hypothetical protein EOP49_50700 [Sphingobacteriales bacterium]